MNKADMKREAGKLLSVYMCKYEGGHPDLPKPGNGVLEICERGTVFDAGMFAQGFYIPHSALLAAEIKTDEQISKDVTLTRLLTLGVLAFGLKKKRVEKHNYLVVKFKDAAGLEQTVIFEGKKMPEAAGQLAKARQKVATSVPSTSPKTEQPASAPKPTVDIADQIRKLAELKAEGILSEDEFQTKKSELLARM